MRKIYKYPLKITGIQKVEMPINNTILSVKEQGGILMLYALVDTEKDTLNYEIEIYGTGYPMDGLHSVREFIDTVIMPNGLVWHIFKRLI